MLATLAELTEDNPFFPSVDPQAANAEEIETRPLMYLPAVYVPLFLNSSGYTARQAWERLYPAIVQRQEEITCRPLLQWLQAASTKTELHNDRDDPAVAIPLCSPPADEALLSQRTQTLHQILPGLNAPPQTLETALSQMATAIISQTNEQKLVREQRAATEFEPILPSAKFTVTLPVLLEYLQVSDERNLPLLWHKWANCKKKQEFQVLRETLEAFARSPHAYSPSVPTITARLVQDLLNFSFVGDSADDIKLGLHPFIITDGNAESRHTNREIARLYGYLQTGDAAISLADLETLQAKEVRSVPLSYWELEKTLGSFGNLIGTVLGITHPLCIAYRAMWDLLQSGIRDDLHTIIEYRGYVKPTHLLRSIQLQFWNWFIYRRNRLTPPTPDLVALINQVLLQLYTLPHLPPSLYQLAYPKKQTTPLNDTFPPGLILSGSASGTSSGSSGDASTVSGLTGSGAAQPPPPGGRGAYISNLAPIPSIIALDKPGVKLRDLIGTTAPPKMTNGTDMCLSYHLRKGCWSNCRRATNHVSTLSAVETQRLQSYITQRLAALTPPSPTPSAANTAFGAPSQGG